MCVIRTVTYIYSTFWDKRILYVSLLRNILFSDSLILYLRCTHRNIVTCTEYAYRKPGSATFRHLRINAVISSTLENSLLACQLRLLLTSLRSRAEALLDCRACQSKSIYEYFSAENTRYAFHRG